MVYVISYVLNESVIFKLCVGFVMSSSSSSSINFKLLNFCVGRSEIKSV